MQLLVSVRSAAEVGPALSGGADIIDAKEPDRGSLGAVSPATLAEILARVPPECPLQRRAGRLLEHPESRHGHRRSSSYPSGQPRPT